MPHFAKVLDGKVLLVNVVHDGFFDDFVDTSPGEWLECAVDGSIRANYPSIGDIYDRTNDVFYHPQPFPSWTLNQTTWTWEPPVPYPDMNKSYVWDEPNEQWIELK